MKTKTPQYDNPSIGCYVDESAGSADDCNERTIKFAESYGFESGLWSDESQQENDEDWSELLSETADKAIEFLNDLETRSFMYWTHDDNSLFLMADPDLAKSDCEFVSSKEQDYPPDDYRGEWLHVNDHGNCTLYVREEIADADGNCKINDREIWSVV